MSVTLRPSVHCLCIKALIQENNNPNSELCNVMAELKTNSLATVFKVNVILSLWLHW